MATAGYIETTFSELEIVIQVEYTAYYEDGETGYPGYEIEDWEVTSVGGRVCSAKVAKWIAKRMTKRERSHVDTLCSEDANNN